MNHLQDEQKRAREEFVEAVSRGDFNKGLGSYGGVPLEAIKPFLDSIVASAFNAGEKARLEEVVVELPKEAKPQDIEPLGGWCKEFADGWDSYRETLLSLLSSLQEEPKSI